MPTEADIEWAARVVITRHGHKAAFVARERASTLAREPCNNAAQIWVRIATAIEDLVEDHSERKISGVVQLSRGR